MKKMKRWIALFVSLLLCLSLCGCQKLDELQATHAIRKDAETIVWNGYEYSLLQGYWTDLNLDGDSLVYITDAEVPVLLSSVFGEAFAVNSEKTLLSHYLYDEIFGEEGERVYCRSDLLDWLEDAFINGYKFETYQFEYYDEATWEYRSYTLTAEQMQAVDTVLQTVDPFAVADHYQSDNSVTLYGYSDYGLFAEEIGWIDYRDGYYYIFRENENETYEWSTDCYIVPDSLYAAFDGIMDAKNQENPVANSNPTAVYPPSLFT